MCLLEDGQLSGGLRGINLYFRLCQQGGHRLHLTRAQVQRYMAELTATGKEANTARLHQGALSQNASWAIRAIRMKNARS